MVYIGIDLGGTDIKAGIVDAHGNIIHKDKCPTEVEKGHVVVIKRMANLALKVLSESGYTLDDVAAVGCGVPGVADEEGVVPFCTNLGWHDVPLRKLMQQHINKPVFIENDATVAGLAEAVAGRSAGRKNSVFLTLGTGLGGGIIIDGKVYSGSHHVGSELGHMVVELNGEQCTCGNKGCWERYASATALVTFAKRAVIGHSNSEIMKLAGGDAEQINAKIIEDAAKAGDALALELWDNYAHALAMGIVTIINFIDPEIILLGGGVSKAGEYLLKPVREYVAKQVFYKTLPYAEIDCAKLGNDAGLIGAAMLGK